MIRLRHSPAGFLRSLQVSRFRLFALVEGKDVDPCFYGGICHALCSRRGIEYQVRTARELPWHAGGKASLLRFYRYLRSRRSLTSALGRTTTAIVFFVDKDIDDLLRTKCRSDHVIYTKYYDVYNHLFRNGDLLTAAAAAAHVDRNELSQHTLFVGDWCQMAAHRWQEWITVCLVAKGSRSGTPGYRLTSQVNSPLNGALNRAQLRAYLERIGHDGGCSVAKVCRDYERTHRRVQGHFSHGDQDSVFKGKWYTTLIELDLQNAFAGRPLRTSGVAQRISTALVATLDFGALWATHFTCAVEKVVDQL